MTLSKLASQQLVLVSSALCLLSLFALDYVTGYEFAFSLFYLVPVCLIAWHHGRAAILIMALAAGVCWLLADQLAGHPYSRTAYGYWNAFTRFGIFAAMGLVLHHLRASLTHGPQESVQHRLRIICDREELAGFLALELDTEFAEELDRPRHTEAPEHFPHRVP
jgi:hypothetical protein